MSFLKKLFGMGGEAPAKPEPKSNPVNSPDLGEPDEPIDCGGVDWNAKGQREFLREVLKPAPADRLLRLLADPDFATNPHCNAADAAVLFAVIAQFEPSRIMEIGCGYTTRVIRAAKDATMMPGELIAIDPEPSIELIEYVDAHLADPLQQVPVDDFRLLQEGELVFVDLPHTTEPGGPMRHFFENVLPAIGPGVLVGFHGVTLPRNYPMEGIAAGHDAQRLLLEFLRNRNPEVLFAAGWLAEEDPESLTGALPQPSRNAISTAFWMRTRV